MALSEPSPGRRDSGGGGREASRPGLVPLGGCSWSPGGQEEPVQGGGQALLFLCGSSVHLGPQELLGQWREQISRVTWHGNPGAVLTGFRLEPHRGADVSSCSVVCEDWCGQESFPAI